MDPILERYQALEDKIKEYNPALDAQRLFRAFTYADNAHAGQLRKDGSPYITHPLAVAEIVAELELDTDSIIAALLHDCIEDTGRHPRGNRQALRHPRWPIWWRGSPS